MKPLFFAVSLLLATSAAAQTPAPGPAPVEAPRKITASRIILVGDSTTAVQGGWGPSFCAYRVTSFVACINLARGGRSSGNYRVEGSWDIALAEMKSGGFAKTYVLIQFGHNDQPGKPGRSTDLATEFPQNLKRYVEETRAAGAIPVLVTPLTRRIFKDGQLVDDLGPWAEATRKVARELNVPLIDLHARSRAEVIRLGPVDAMRFAQEPPAPHIRDAAKSGTTVEASTPVPVPANATEEERRNLTESMNRTKSAFDYTHIGREGADVFAEMVAEDLATVVPELKRGLVLKAK
ncbi:rhamnogalacturonan acetylesterase [Asticcacaulis sp. BYS171W]|uniref:Rhamnogalacturonan acetylesterase n=1 Tax=Asticcacaulis aquaticus TaxID=2984212 RepID=A0ABT5HVM1_9CAUL|nr:rhamnogalacturonan acetylesterase [Asticcacaulis aquaticus]MDC7684131.1 rhamnogalacturonan acetylesterase [Asticcacaulis aquaticus]